MKNKLLYHIKFHCTAESRFLRDVGEKILAYVVDNFLILLVYSALLLNGKIIVSTLSSKLNVQSELVGCVISVSLILMFINANSQHLFDSMVEKTIPFYITIGFGKLDLFGLKALEIAIPCAVEALYLSLLVQGMLELKWYGALLLLPLLLLILIVPSVLISSTGKKNSGRLRLHFRSIVLPLKNPYTAWMYKDLRCMSQSTLWLGVLINVALIVASAVYAEHLGAAGTELILCLMSVFCVASTADFYYIENVNHLMYKLIGVTEKRIFRHKLYNVSCYSLAFVLPYIIVNFAVGNFSLYKTAVFAVFYTVHIFLSVMYVGLKCIEDYPRCKRASNSLIVRTSVCAVPFAPMVLLCVNRKKLLQYLR